MRGSTRNIIFQLLFIQIVVNLAYGNDKLYHLTELDIIHFGESTLEFFCKVAKDQCGVDEPMSLSIEELSNSLVDCMNKNKATFEAVLQNFDHKLLQITDLKEFHGFFLQLRHAMIELKNTKRTSKIWLKKPAFESDTLAKLLLAGVSSFGETIMQFLIEEYKNMHETSPNPLIETQISSFQAKLDFYQKMKQISAELNVPDEVQHKMDQICVPLKTQIEYHIRPHFKSLEMQEYRFIEDLIQELCKRESFHGIIRGHFDDELASEFANYLVEECIPSVKKFDKYYESIYLNLFTGVNHRKLGTATAWFSELQEHLEQNDRNKFASLFYDQEHLDHQNDQNKFTNLIYGASLISIALNSKLYVGVENLDIQKWMLKINGRLGKMQSSATENLEKFFKKVESLKNSVQQNRHILLPMAYGGN